MAELHEALKALEPTNWSDVPQQEKELDAYLGDMFKKAQLIIDSVPLPSPEDAPQHPKYQAHNTATKATDVTLSAERSAPPPFGHEKFQKEWGKPVKVKAQENPLGVSVYKMSGKDGRGAWFARHSVHEGIGFNKFKKSLQMEFEKSMAEKGPPGTGNVRGIGGEERVVDITIPGKGRVEIFHLSAQFPGPVAPRDFVTMLTTSNEAIQTGSGDGEKTPKPLEPRHHIMISKPCNHDKAQPANGWVRGNYESIEFIREVPRKLKSSQSAIDISDGQRHHAQSVNASDEHLHHHKRDRSVTVNDANTDAHAQSKDPFDPEDNPVEWIMITRSDPGGGIPRFLVDRGTPGSICGDVVKFLDWACQNKVADTNDDDNADKFSTPISPTGPPHKSWRSRSLVGIDEDEQSVKSAQTSVASEASSLGTTTADTPSQGIMDTISGAALGAAAALKPYTPDVIAKNLPGTPEIVEPTGQVNEQKTEAFPAFEDDAKSFMSSTSYASADSHLTSDEASIGSESASHKLQTQQEKELRKISERRQTLQRKHAATISKLDEAKAKQIGKDEGAAQKAIEKHGKEVKKHEEKYQKELSKLDRKQDRQQKKHEEKQRKQADRDEKQKLTRERDEARKELDLMKKEADSLQTLVQELQKENTTLVMKLGRLGVDKNDALSEGRSRASSSSRK